MEFDIVIAVYHETLEWLVQFRPFVRKVYIYSRIESRALTDMMIPEGIPCEWNYLPNVGREAAVYLHHILRVYGHPEEFGSKTLFTMGCSVGNNRMNELKWETMMRILRRLGLDVPCKSLEESHEPYGIDANVLSAFVANSHFNSNPINVEPGESRVHRCESACLRPFGAWYHSFLFPYTHKPLNQDLLQRLKYHAAIFAISNRDIFKYPDHLYDELLQQALRGKSPEVSHYIERSWKILFDTI